VNEQEQPLYHNEEPEQEEKIPPLKSFVLYLHDLMYLLSVMMVVLLLVFRVVVVSGTSMNMTLLNGDYLLLLSNTFYHNPDQGDIIVVSKDSFDDGAAFVKRVIATEGQTVDIDFDAGIVYVDGFELEEDHIFSPTIRDEGVQFPLKVEKGHVFVLGDNRGSSTDSRSPMIGQVDCREIVGKAIFIMSPGDNGGTENRRWDRIGWIG
jgi:signal peptidase I